MSGLWTHGLVFLLHGTLMPAKLMTSVELQLIYAGANDTRTGQRAISKAQGNVYNSTLGQRYGESKEGGDYSTLGSMSHRLVQVNPLLQYTLLFDQAVPS